MKFDTKLTHRIPINTTTTYQPVGGARTEQPKRKTITYPAEVTKRGNTHYVTILKSYMEMLGIKEGDIVDVTIRRPEEDQTGDDQ